MQQSEILPTFRHSAVCDDGRCQEIKLPVPVVRVLFAVARRTDHVLAGVELAWIRIPLPTVSFAPLHAILMLLVQRCWLSCGASTWCALCCECLWSDSIVAQGTNKWVCSRHMLAVLSFDLSCSRRGWAAVCRALVSASHLRSSRDITLLRRHHSGFWHERHRWKQQPARYALQFLHHHDNC